MSEPNTHGQGHDGGGGAHGGGKHAHHVVPMKIYIGIFATLLFLTFVTVAVAQVDLGPANMLVAMFVATIKASLVCLFFMQLKYDEKLNSIIFVFGLIFVALFFLFTSLDVFSRGYLDPRQSNTYMQQEDLRALRYEVEQKRARPLPTAGLAADTPPKEELTPPPPPPVAPDAGVGSAPGSVPGALPTDAAPAPASAAPSH